MTRQRKQRTPERNILFELNRVTHMDDDYVKAASCARRTQEIKDLLAAQHEDTKEILRVLRGGKDAQDAGLVGIVSGHEKRLNGITQIFKALWTFIAALVLAVVANFLKK